MLKHNSETTCNASCEMFSLLKNNVTRVLHFRFQTGLVEKFIVPMRSLTAVVFLRSQRQAVLHHIKPTTVTISKWTV